MRGLSFPRSVVVSFGCRLAVRPILTITRRIPEVALVFCSDKRHKLDQALSQLSRNDDESRGAVESSTLGLQGSLC
jgi:tRNA A37 methylthiotransferase MiaB